MLVSGDVCQKFLHMFHRFLKVFGYDMPHVDLPMGKLQDCPVLADHRERFGKETKTAWSVIQVWGDVDTKMNGILESYWRNVY